MEFDARWWLYHETESEVHKVVTTLAKEIWAQQATRRRQWKRWATCYGLDVNAVMDYDTSREYRAAQHARNAAQTVIASLCANRALPWVVVKNGDNELNRKARKCNAVILGEFQRNRFFDLDSLLQLDAYIFGLGVLRIGSEHDRVKGWRVLPSDLLMDDREWLENMGQTLYQHTRIDRYDFAATVEALDRPDAASLAKKIRDETPAAPIIADDWFGTIVRERTSDQIMITEAFRLPSFPGSGDGRYVMCLENVDIANEEWERDNFPYAFFRFTSPVVGAYGDSVMKYVAPLQEEYNVMSDRISRAHAIFGRPNLIVDPSQAKNFTKEKLQNSKYAPGILVGDKNLIDVWNPTPVSRDTYEYVNVTLKNAIYETSWANQMAAQAQVPKQLESGTAIDTYSEEKKERLTIAYRNRDQGWVDAGRLVLQENAEIAKRKPGHTIKGRDGKTLELIKATEIMMDEHEFDLDIMPTNFFSQTIPARLDQAERLAQMNMVDPREIARTFDSPDVEKLTRRITAPFDIVDTWMDRMLSSDDEDVYFAPDPLVMQPEEMLKRSLMAYQEAILNSFDNPLPEFRLDKIRTFISQCKSLIAGVAQAVAPTPGMGPAGMPAGGPPPPIDASALPPMGGPPGGPVPSSPPPGMPPQGGPPGMPPMAPPQ